MDEPEEKRPTTRGERWGLVLFGALVFGLFAVELLGSLQASKLTVLFMVGGWVAMLAVHQAGHAVMAAVLGWRVCRVVVGFGKTLAEFRVAGTPVEVRLFPASGFVVPAPRELAGARLKSALIYLAGPGTELSLVVLIAIVLGPERLLSGSEAIGVLLLQSLCLVALLGALLHLIPLPTREGAWTDGLGALKSLFAGDRYFQGLLGTPYVIEAEQRLKAGDRAGAQLMLERGLADHPDNLPVLTRLCAGLIEAGVPRLVLERLEPLLERENVPKGLQPRILDLLAQALLDVALSGAERRLDEADEYSQIAVDRQPGDPWALLTRAQVLIELGRYHDARELLEQLEAGSPQGELLREVSLVALWLDFERGQRQQALEQWRRLSVSAADGQVATRVQKALGL